MLSKSIETLVDDISKLFDGHDLEAAVSEFSSGISDLFVRRFIEYGTERDRSLRLSNVGWPLRKLFYTVKGYPAERMPSAAKVKFLYGDLIESLFIFLAAESGHTVENFQKEVEVDNVPGHIDCTIDGVLVDVKSCSTPSYKKFVSGDLYENDPFGYVAQLKGYKTALQTVRAGWLIIDKTLGNFDFVELKEDGDSFDIHERIRVAKEALASNAVPDKCYLPKPNDKSGNYILSTGCSYCVHKQYCWRDANNGQGLIQRTYSTGPRWFTTLAKEPKLRDYGKTFDKFPRKSSEDLSSEEQQID